MVKEPWGNEHPESFWTHWKGEGVHHVLEMVHAHKGANMRKNILKGVRELGGVNAAKTRANGTSIEAIVNEVEDAKSWRTGGWGCSGWPRKILPADTKFQVHIVVEVQVVQVLKAPS